MKAKNKKQIIKLLEDEIREHVNEVMMICDIQNKPLNLYKKNIYYKDLCKAIDVLENNI